MSMFPSQSILESPMLLASFGRPSVTGVSSVVVDSMLEMLFGRHVGLVVPRHHAALKLEDLKA